MKILITGAGGFIGKHLSKYLRDQHHIVNIYSQPLKTESKNNYYINLLDENSVKKYIDKLQDIDVVINLASKMSDKSNYYDVSLLHDNLKICENVIVLIKNIKPKQVVNFSSFAVYPHMDGEFNENSIISPQNNPDCIYGLSKYCTEVMLDFLLHNSNIQIVHLRISIVNGVGMRSDRIVPVLLKELKDKNVMTLYGNGERISNFIEVKDLCRIINLVIKNNYNGIYNVGGENISFYKLAKKLINEHGNKESKIKLVNHGRKEKFIFNSEKLNKLF